MKHTPGPWVVTHPLHSNTFYIHTKDESFDNDDGEAPHICEVFDPLGKFDNKANAHLIAAAPNMLKELEDIAEAIKGTYKDEHREIPWDELSDLLISILNDSLKLIAQAKGESQ